MKLGGIPNRNSKIAPFCAIGRQVWTCLKMKCDEIPKSKNEMNKKASSQWQWCNDFNVLFQECTEQYSKSKPSSWRRSFRSEGKGSWEKWRKITGGRQSQGAWQRGREGCRVRGPWQGLEAVWRGCGAGPSPAGLLQQPGPGETYFWMDQGEYFGLAQCLRLLGRPEAALRDLDTAVRLSGGGRGQAGAAALCQRGVLHRKVETQRRWKSLIVNAGGERRWRCVWFQTRCLGGIRVREEHVGRDEPLRRYV